MKETLDSSGIETKSKEKLRTIKEENNTKQLIIFCLDSLVMNKLTTLIPDKKKNLYLIL